MNNKLKWKYKEGFGFLEALSLLDDGFMTIVFDRNIVATELVLNVILGRDDMKVIEVVAQREYKNPVMGGRSIKLDIYAEDSDGKVYDVEVQNESAGADIHRARFHSSMLDTRMLKEKQQFKAIHDSYVIFITKNDYMKLGLPMYHVERVIQESGTLFGDGSHIIYVNGSYKDNSDPVGRLMHDFRCTSAADMFYPELAEPVRHFKETEGGQSQMSNFIEEYGKKVALKEKEASALKMIARGKLTIEEIAEDLELPIERVEELAGLQSV